MVRLSIMKGLCSSEVILSWAVYDHSALTSRTKTSSSGNSWRHLSLLTGLFVLLAAARLCQKDLISFHFDDAGMFYRYAWNLRHGYGLAWNVGQGPVFGLTSIPWVFLILLGSLFSTNPIHVVVALSFITGILALATIAWFASRRAISAPFRNFALAFSLVSLPLLLHPWFETTLGNGMETMLALWALAAFLEGFRRFTESPTALRTLSAASLGTLCVLIRPELILCALLVPFMNWLLILQRRKTAALLLYVALLSLFIGTNLLANWAYFGTPVPLAFYIKSFGAYYKGYRPFINPLGYASMFFSIAAPFLLAIAFLARRKDWRMLAVYLIPTAATMLYLCTVTQIMGWRGRYYIPLLAMLLMPALELADRAADEGEMPRWSRGRLAAFGLVFFLVSPLSERVYGPIGHAIASSRRIYLAPQFRHAAQGELPSIEWYASCKSFVEMAKELPAGISISSSEVGLVGASLLHAKVIDSAGLNDSTLALHGFSTSYLLSQQPDLIWLPHPDYSYLYGSFSSDSRLLQQYDVYAGVFNHGIALRKDSRFYPQMKAALQQTFQATYPGYGLEGYKTKSVTWDPTRTRPGTPEDSVTP